MKKILCIFLCFVLSVSVCSFFFACGKDNEQGIFYFPIDSDYDGIPDEEDLKPNDNTYSFNFVDAERGKETKYDTLTVDYRNFLFDKTPKLNLEIAKMAAIAVEEVMFENDVEYVNLKDCFYDNQESGEYPHLRQLGLREIEKTTLRHEDFEFDKNDLCGTVIGNSVVRGKDGKYTQVIFVTLNPYVDDTGWDSNFDLGADTESYTSVTGIHPDWTNKKNHKGFDVSASRVYPLITEYIESHKKEHATPLVFVTGQSRGGSISNILGKMLTDDGIKNLVYSFNPANTTTETTEETEKYDSLFSIVNTDDLISLVPLENWNGFKLYGNKCVFSVSKDPSAWKEYTGSSYKWLGKDFAVAEGLFNEITEDRESVYEFCSVRIKESDYYVTTDKEEADKKEQELLSAFPEESEARKCIKTQVDFDGEKYTVKYFYRPALMICLFDDVAHGFSLDKIVPYINYFSGYITDLGFALKMALSGDVYAIKNAHCLKTDLIGVKSILNIK